MRNLWGPVGSPPSADSRSTAAEVLRGSIHELKGPVSRLRVLSELLNRSAVLDDDAKTLIRHISDSANALDGVAGAIRNYSELCGRPPRLDLIDLTGPLETALARLDPVIQKAGVQVSQTPLPTVAADFVQMTWLFEELLNNAIRFCTDDSPCIAISAMPGEGNRVSISDNGPGIEADLAERVFLPFKKMAANGGAGLGLTICREIVEMHGGRMWVEPRTGGAEFRFFLGEATER